MPRRPLQMTTHVEAILDEAAALWKANLIYFQGGGWKGVPGTGNYRWKDVERRLYKRDVPAAVKGAVRGRVIPHNKVIKRAFESVDQGLLPEWKQGLGNFLGNLADNRSFDERDALEYLNTHKAAMRKR